eukprot:COSAG06_NODE_11806_length_1462_cov_2.268525_1_plen_62_part_00
MVRNTHTLGRWTGASFGGGGQELALGAVDRSYCRVLVTPDADTDYPDQRGWDACLGYSTVG